MLRSLYTAATGMGAQQKAVDVVSNNLANANTTGFKRSQADFEDLLYSALERPGAVRADGRFAPTGLEIGSGARLVSTTKVFEQGAIEETTRNLDVAIDGNGFMQVNLPDGGVGYTRDGALRLSADGLLVNNQGNPLEPQSSIPDDATDIQIGQDGTVAVTTAGSSEPTTVGSLTLVKFANPSGLLSMGGNVYQETPASGAPVTGTAGADGFGELRQGFVERSNVSVVNELVQLIVSQRAYEINTRAIKVGDEMLGSLNELIR